MWKGERYTRMIPKLQNHPLIGEIIIIDNDVSNTDISVLNFSKIVHLPQKENIYVNPAWNLGAKVAQFDKLCFLNDDIEFDVNQVIDVVYPHIKQQIGIIGFAGEVIKDESVNAYEEEYQYEQTCVTHCATMHPKYGICMFIHKYNYSEIPSEYKIWFGDNYLFSENKSFGRENYVIRGKDIKVLTKMSSTSKHPSTVDHFNEIWISDSTAYKANNAYDFNAYDFMHEGLLELVEDDLMDGVIDLNKVHSQ